MDTETSIQTAPRSRKSLFLAVTLSLLPLSALVYWGYNALNEPQREVAPKKKSRPLPKPEESAGPRRILLSGPQVPPPIPETAQFTTEGGFFLSNYVEPPRFVTESSWTIQARSSRRPVTVHAQGRKETFADGVIRFKLKNLKEGRQSHAILVKDAKKNTLRGSVPLIVDTKAPSLVLFDLQGESLRLKLGDSVQGRVQDPYLKNLKINGEAWSYDQKGLFTYTPDRVGEQVIIVRATDLAGQSRELKAVLKVEEAEQASPNKEAEELLESPLAATWTRNRRNWKYFGASTCGGASCHAARKPQKTRPGNEYVTWSTHDRHAKAFNTLFEEEATEMAEELGIEDPSQDKSCTVCHITDVPKSLQGEKYNKEDGVSCDGCHGPSEGWFKPHTKPHKYEDMLKLGMWNTRNIWRRADVCIKCHSQIDDSLVDAGHPYLSFEIFSATQRQPVHYYERNSWDPVRLWSVGLLVAAREDTMAIQKAVKAKDDSFTLEFLSAKYESKIPLLKLLPSGLRNARRGPFKKLALIYEDEKISEKELKSLKKLTVEFNRWAKRLASTGPRSRYFERTRLKILAENILRDKPDKMTWDEFRASHTAGALWALYNSYYYGEKARMKAPVVQREIFGNLEVRPGVYKHESLFDEEGTFRLKFWSDRLRPLKRLFEEAPSRRPR